MPSSGVWEFLYSLPPWSFGILVLLALGFFLDVEGILGFFGRSRRGKREDAPDDSDHQRN